jgi:hypothetical protein
VLRRAIDQWTLRWRFLLCRSSSNAFLTLRVGMIAKRYCAALVVADKRLLRRATVVEATKLLAGLLRMGQCALQGCRKRSQKPS